jgi:RNA polymerase sigma factor (sigma-70 family)
MDTFKDRDNTALDSELLGQMAEAGTDVAVAGKAWEEFYRRHYEYLLSVCRNAHSSRIGEGRVPEVVQDSFVKAFRKANTFEPSVGQSAEESRWHVRGWLGSILENTIRDLYRQEPQVVFSEDMELFADNRQTSQDATEEVAIGPVEKAFLELDDREREILLETMLWYRPGARQQRMPSDALQALATKLKTTTMNIRQIRSRALAKLKHATGEKQ